jgi:hypothetical protein
VDENIRHSSIFPSWVLVLWSPPVR